MALYSSALTGLPKDFEFYEPIEYFTEFGKYVCAAIRPRIHASFVTLQTLGGHDIADWEDRAWMRRLLNQAAYSAAYQLESMHAPPAQ